jgi:hypothetical protein
MEKKKRRKSKHSKKRKHQHSDTRCSRSPDSDNDSDIASTEIPTLHKKSEIKNNEEPMNGISDKKPIATEPARSQAKVQTEAKGPMTQAQYLQLQSQIREVVDPATGRVRLVRGNGEIIERIVTKNEHQRLNALATRGDGDGYAKEVARQAMLRRLGR